MLSSGSLEHGQQSQTVFARSTTPTFDATIIRAVRDAGRKAGLNYGRNVKDGFTIHCLRHTYITEVLQRTGDIATTMKLSGHKSLASFSVYLHALEFGYKKAVQVIESIDGFLTAFSGGEHVENVGNTSKLSANPSHIQQVKTA